MKLVSARVQHFRSIVDSDTVDIDEHVTVVIGKNEQGKTTFLRGIASFSPAITYSANDLPQHMRPNLETQPRNEIPIVTLCFSVDESEKLDLKDLIHDTGAIIKGFKITRYYDGHYAYSLISEENAEQTIGVNKPDITALIEELKLSAVQLKSKLLEHVSRLPAFGPHKAQADQHLATFLAADFSAVDQIENLIKTLSTALGGVPGQDQPIQNELALTSKQLQTILVRIRQTLDTPNPLQKLLDIIPKFVFHSTSIDRIPNEVNLNDFIKDPEGTSRGMANLCRAAGLSIQKIQSLASSTTDVNTREAYEDHYKSAISGAINEFWSQENYTVSFRFENTRLSVSVSDEKYGRRIAPSERSEGFQWYLSFYCTLLNEASSSTPLVLLLDNPGLELHSDGQRDIKKSLEDKHSVSAQVIYVTHSPAMIDPYRLEQVRQVELMPEFQGTKVKKLSPKSPEDLDLLEPVRSAIGASLITSLAYNKKNILVEGAADTQIILGAVLALHKEWEGKLVVNGSVSESSYLLPLFFEKACISYVVYLDSDNGGRHIKTNLLRHKVPEVKIIELRDVMGDDYHQGADIELEDIISIEDYYSAVVAAYPNNKEIERMPTGESKKQTKFYRDFFKKKQYGSFTKTVVAAILKKKLEQGSFSEDTKGNLQKLLKKFSEALQL
jgi:predicted ATP-dependent endonuclease of OLD family